MSKPILADAYPELTKQWHPTKNGDLTPSDVTSGSGKKVWWVCPTNPEHEWATRVYNRVRGRGCPFCAGKRKFGYEYKVLADAYPDLVKEWHPVKNGELYPHDVTEGSSKVVWWLCSNDSSHEWKAAVWARTHGRGKCPACYGKIPSKKTSLAARYPHIAKQWHPTKNGDLTPHDVFPNSREKVWWQCTENPEHEWQAIIRSRVTSQGYCKFCLREKPIKKPSLAKYDPDLVREWHPTLNGDKTPSDVTAGSTFKAWWICKENPNHVWQATVNNRARGKGCPFCAGQIAGDRNLAVLHPEIAEEWHPTKNGDLTPDVVSPGSHRKVWWQCSVDPSHEWQAFVFGRVNGWGKCPVCNDSERKSFSEVYPDVAQEWHPTKNVDLTPDDILHCSSQKYWWQCRTNPEHVWQATAQNRGVNQSGCPFCRREKASQELTDYLIDSVKSNTEFYKNFLSGIENIRKLAGVNLNDEELEQTLLRLLYANAVTVMETYLSDAFTNTVLESDDLIRKLVETSPYFERKKFAVSNLFAWMDKIPREVTKYLQDEVTYHNIWRVRSMYETVLGLEFPEDLMNVQVAIMTRHDIVHRNGKTKDGDSVTLSRADIQNVTHTIQDFISYVEGQLQGFLTPH